MMGWEYLRGRFRSFRYFHFAFQTACECQQLFRSAYKALGMWCSAFHSCRCTWRDFLDPIFTVCCNHCEITMPKVFSPQVKGGRDNHQLSKVTNKTANVCPLFWFTNKSKIQGIYDSKYIARLSYCLKSIGQKKEQ
jgi:hypothetical protein